MRLQGSSTDSLKPTVLSVCLKRQVTFSHHALWFVTTHTCIRVDAELIYDKTQCFPHNVISNRIFWLEISQSEIINGVKPLRREACTYILNILHMMTHCERIFCPQTYHRLWTAHMHMHTKSHHSEVKTSCYYSSSCPTREGLFMKLFWQIVYETAWCIYVFIYFAFSFLNLLYRVSEKDVVLDLGQLKVLH